MKKKLILILSAFMFFVVSSISSISFANEITWGEVISKGKVVATSHADLRDSNRWSWQHYMTVIYQNRVFFCTHSKTDKSLIAPKKHWIGCDESQ